MSLEEELELLREELETEKKARLAAEKKLLKKDAEFMQLHEQWQNEINTQSNKVEILARIPEELSDPFFRISATGHIQYLNPACSDQLSPILGLHIGDPYPPIFSDALEKAIVKETLVTEEFKIGARYYLVQFSAVPIPGYINVIAREISAQKLIEQQLKTSEARFRQIIETATEIIYRIIDGKIIYANPIAAQLTGFSKKEIERIEFKELIHPDFREEITDFYEQQKRRQILTSYLEFPIITAEGNSVWLGQNAQLHIDRKNQKELIIVARDITARKKAETELQLTSTRLSTLIRSMHTGVLVEDENRKIVLVNEQFLDIFNISLPANELLGTDSRQLSQMLKKSFPNEVDFILNTADILAAREVKIGETIRTVNGLILDRDYVPIQNDGHFLGHLWQYRNVTEFRANEEALRRNKEALMEAQEQARLGSWELDVNSNQLWWSSIMCEQFGLTQEEVPTDGVEFLKFFLPEDAEILRTNLMNSVGEEVKTFEARILRNDNSLRYLQMSIRCNYNEQGAITYISGTSLDVTQQREMQEQLRQSEERFQLAMQGINDGIWDWNLVENTVYLSPRWKEIVGYKPHELANTHEAIRTIIRDKDLDWLREKVASLSASGSRQISNNFQMKHRDGHWLTIMMRGVVVFDKEGTAVRVVGANADVTEQVKAKEKLQNNYEAQRLLSNISFSFNINSEDYSSEITDSLEQMGINTNVSRAYIFENTADNEFTSNTFEWCSEGVHSQIDDLQSIPFSTIPDFKDLMINEQGLICTDTEVLTGAMSEMITAQGIQSIMLFPILVKQEMRGFVGFDECRRKREWEESEIQLLRTYANLLSNVFERQEAEMKLQDSEEKYRSLVESLNEVIFQTDAQLSLNFLNPAWEQITGYSMDDSLGSQLNDYIHPDDQKDFLSIYPILFERETDFYGQQFRLVTSANEIRWIEFYARPSLDRYNQIDGFLGTFMDVTERKNAELELIQAKDAAEQASLAKAQFLSIVSHEIRTPLNAVIGIAELLQRNNPRPDQEQNIGILKFSGENLLNLINDILDFNKIEAGKLELEVTEFNLRKLTEHLCQTQEFKAREKGIHLTLKVDEQIPLFLLGDPTRLTQILHNLLSNAIKFTEKGEVELDIQLQQKQGKQVTLHFEITDTGIGIPADKLTTIFEAFSQARANTTRLFGGTGLGLSITQRLIQLHGHDIDVESCEGEGSCFSFQLTYAISDRKPQPQQQNQQKNTLKNTELQGLRVLLAEDHPINVLVASQYLEQWGVTITVAENGIEALKAIKETAFDLVLMDLQMPEMDGYQASLEIRKVFPADVLPIIAISADILEANAEKVTQFGMNDYISKPFNPDELFRKLLIYSKKADDQLLEKLAESPVEAPAYNLDKLLADSSGNEVFVRKIIQAFLKTTPDIIQKMEAAWQGRQWDAFRKLAHKLKPSIDLLQVDKLRANIRSLEKISVTDSPNDLQHEQFLMLKKTLQLVILQLKEHFTTLEKAP